MYFFLLNNKFFMASVRNHNISAIQRFILFHQTNLPNTSFACLYFYKVKSYLFPEDLKKMRWEYSRFCYLQKIQLKHSQGKSVLSKLIEFCFAHWPCVLFQILFLFAPLTLSWSCRVSAGLYRSSPVLGHCSILIPKSIFEMHWVVWTEAGYMFACSMYRISSC